MDNKMYEWNMIFYATIEKKKMVKVMYTPNFSLSFTLLFSFLFILLQSYADISTMLTYARHFIYLWPHAFSHKNHERYGQL